MQTNRSPDPELKKRVELCWRASGNRGNTVRGAARRWKEEFSVKSRERKVNVGKSCGAIEADYRGRDTKLAGL